MKKILITSIGRTGTVSLTHFLNTIEGVSSFHEKERQDVPFLFLSQINRFSNIVTDYFKQRDQEASKLNCDFYIEVNPYFRFADKKMVTDLGWKKIFIVRNPKSYIESVYTRNLFTKNDIICGQFPDNNDSVSKVWGELTRFQKICWYYGKVHRYILKSELCYFQFEKLTSSSQELKLLLSNIGIEPAYVKKDYLPKYNTSFKNKVRRRVSLSIRGVNISTASLDWSSLSKAEIDFYKSYCVEPAKSLGYVL